MIISQSGVVDLIPEYNRALRPIFCVSEGDAGSRMINLTVQNAGENFTIPTGAMVYVAGRKKDNTIFSYQCMFSGYIVTFPVSAQMSAEDGIVLCELQIVVNSEPLGSANFVYWVEPSPIENGIASESDLNIFEQAIALLSNFDHFYADVEDLVTEAVSNIQIHEGQTVIDASLSVSGAAADAKATGDKIKEMYGAFFEETVTGETVTFDDGAEGVSVKQIVADILPMQNLNGYTKPWPGGTGKNLWPFGDDLVTQTTQVPLDAPIPAGTYHLSGTITGQLAVRFWYDSSTNALAYCGDTVTFTNNVIGVTWWANNITASNIQLEAGSEATAFEPYANVCPITGYDDVTFTRSNGLLPPGDVETYTVTMPTSAGTVYGGTLTVNDDGSGTIVVNRKTVNLSSSMSWTSTGSVGSNFRIYTNFADHAPQTDGWTYTDIWCSHLEYLVGNPGDFGTFNYTFAGNFSVKDKNGVFGTKAALVQWLDDQITAGTPVQVEYPINPVTYALTAPQVKTLLGNNSISMDADGEMTVTYRVNTAIYIDKRIAAIIGTDGNAW